MSKIKKKIAITTGDVNGIGAEIVIKALEKLDFSDVEIVLISNSDVLEFYNKSLNYSKFKTCKLVEIEFDKNDIIPGSVTKESGEFSFKSLTKACELVKLGEVDAIVTAPVSKEALHLAGYNFNGQTEVLQEFLSRDNQEAEMLFVANDFRVLLLTRHVALKEISLKKEDIIRKIIKLDSFFKEKFAIDAPKFALCALNPHAGEGGILGREEIEIIQPAVNELRNKGIDITNPLPADTLFIQASKEYLQSLHSLNFTPHAYDCYIAMYHDQGLIPIKSVASDKTVNMTIGLDVIRTSPCHGTAYDIAGKGIADENSMIEAIMQVVKA